ncbi:CPBP family intramembrane glutamic endopeptidase [Galactobacter caseinivorans]|nr:type II CAAX endopeptidase family protein [Galactobacter caseinivorans]
MSYPAHFAPTPYPPAMPAPRKRPRHPEAKLGRFSVMDWVTFAFYVGLMFVLPLALTALLGDAAAEAEAAAADEDQFSSFVVNFGMYAILVTLTLFALGRELWRSFKTFLWYPWAKFCGLPAAWFATIIATAVLVALAAAASGVGLDGVNQSQNQDAATAMMQAIPWPLMVLMVGLMGPLVEEYIFRHLLVGKLSRWINPWVLVVLSALVFMSLHFIGKEWPTLMTGLPYLLMGISFGAGYVLSGKSIAYSYCMHAFSNCMALLLTYTTAGA